MGRGTISGLEAQEGNAEERPSWQHPPRRLGLSLKPSCISTLSVHSIVKEAWGAGAEDPYGKSVWCQLGDIKEYSSVRKSTLPSRCQVRVGATNFTTRSKVE
jgi:hypothetical protein